MVILIKQFRQKPGLLFFFAPAERGKAAEEVDAMPRTLWLAIGFALIQLASKHLKFPENFAAQQTPFSSWRHCGRICFSAQASKIGGLSARQRKISN